MAQLQPMALQFVEPAWTAEVPSPPHDALTPEARRVHLTAHPHSFLGVTRAPEDQGDGVLLTPAQMLEAGKVALESLLEAGVFGPVQEPGLYLYRLEYGEHRQTALVCGVAVADYLDGTVRIHEQVNPDRSRHLANHLEVVGAQSSPIALGFGDDEAVAKIMRSVASANKPFLDFEDDTGLRQQLWSMTDSSVSDRIIEALRSKPLYLIDGHHRASAAAEFHSTRSDPERSGADAWMLAALFPISELKNQAFHRVLTIPDLAGLEAKIGERFPHRYTDDPNTVGDRHEGELAVALRTDDGPIRWLLFDVPVTESEPSPLSGLDPVRLNRHVFSPLLGIDEATPDPRLEYRPGSADIEAAARLQLEPNQAMFWMRPVPMSTLMASSDMGLAMPPKSTYFEPKVRSGLMVRSVR